ncbi:MAG: right-handed parallel beta-helix repeat-containing protein [Candidatus Heimdallarchaeaceae archaeon]
MQKNFNIENNKQKKNKLRRKGLTSILVILAVLICSSNLINNELMNIQQKDLNEENIKSRFPSLTLTAHDPIEIASDAEFSIFPGAGTPDDPYIIEGFNIATTSNYGIYIYDTTKYFIVRNCFVDASYIGIYIYNTTDGTATITNNTCSNNNYGIYLWYSNSATLTNNTCSNNNWYGIYLSYSDSATLTNNTCTNNNYGGIYLVHSDSPTLTNNTCSSNYEGIYLSYSDSATLTNNTCSSNYEGIYLSYSDSATLTNNIFLNNGLYITGNLDNLLSHTISNNYVNGKLLGYFTNIQDIAIDVPIYGQLFIINGTNVTIKNQVITNTSTGITVIYSQATTITNNTCSINNYGIYLWSSDFATLTNNTCSNNNCTGIYLSYSDSATLINNTCSNNWHGILLDYSDSATLTNNTCSNNDCAGILLDYSDSATLTNNTCSNNNYGIYLWSSDCITLTNNFCFYNKGCGLRLHSSNHSIISKNVLVENFGYGITLESSHNTTIYNNIFIDNNLAGDSQGYDDTGDNYWYNPDTEQGNYWSDWNNIGNYSIDLGLAFDLQPQIFNDIDNDGLYDIIEIFVTHTDPTNSDTDEDGMSDGWEVDNNLNPLKNDANEDLDNDGLTNIEESTIGTFANNIDTDMDQLSDYQEVKIYLTNPLDEDTDGDNLLDGEEVNNYGTDPNNSDTDKDNLTDYEEVVYYNTNANSSDSDGDGLDDYEEIKQYGTDPNNVDTDGDNLNDYEEIKQYGTDPNNVDTDGDGLNDYDEVLTYGTNPNDSDSDKDGKSDGWEVNNGFDPTSHTLLFIHNKYLCILIYTSPFVGFLQTVVIVIFVIKRRKRNIRLLEKFYQEQEGNLISILDLIKQFKQRNIIILSELNEDFIPVLQKASVSILEHSKIKKLRKLMSKKWFYKLGVNREKFVEFEEIIEGLVIIFDKLDYSEVQSIFNESEMIFNELKDIDSVYQRLDELKKVIDNFRIMLKELRNISSFYLPYLSNNIKSLFETKITKLENLTADWENEIVQLDGQREVLEAKFLEIKRIQTINNIIQLYSRISIDRLMNMLQFQKREDLEKWLLDNFPDSNYIIEGDDIVFQTEADKEEITKAIDSLLEEYDRWTKEGKGKKN